MGNETSKTGAGGAAATPAPVNPRASPKPLNPAAVMKSQPPNGSTGPATTRIVSQQSSPQTQQPPPSKNSLMSTPKQWASAPVPFASASANDGQITSADSSISRSFNANVNSTSEFLGGSVPRYVDASSMVYTFPSPPADCLTQTGSPHPPATSSQPLASAPVPLRGSTSASERRLGATSSPLSPMRRHLTAVHPVSTPIAIPIYNTSTTTAVEELSCSSPVLRSYRQHSFSVSKRDLCFATSPPAPQLGVSSLTASMQEGSMLMPSTPTPNVGSASSPAIHTRFLEITGHPLGLENYGNTCYCNSVIQLIYHCTPLRLRLLELNDVYQSKKGKSGFEENTVLYQLCSLMAVMHRSNNRSKDKYPREKIATRDLLQCVRSRNEVFNNDMQQDAHEFAMYLLNDITETEQCIMADPSNENLFLQQEATALKSGKKGSSSSSFAFWKNSKDKSISTNHQKITGKNEKSKGAAAATTSSNATTVVGCATPLPPSQQELTPLQVILQGQFGSLTACLECENITSRDEVFIDLSLETAPGCSLLRCLDHFGDPEYFWGKNKLRCDECHASVRAAKTIHVQQLPQYALLIHLKRFQYDVKKQTFTKKADHVALPMQMDVEEYLTDPEVIEQSVRNDRARSQTQEAKNDSGTSAAATAKDSEGYGKQKESLNTTPDTFKPASPDVRRKLRGVARHKARFELTGFVAHLGEGPNSGHYFTCVRYGPQLWRRFDDDTVSTMAERDVQQYFGVPTDATGVVTTTAYILLYERVA